MASRTARTSRPAGLADRSGRLSSILRQVYQRREALDGGEVVDALGKSLLLTRAPGDAGSNFTVTFGGTIDPSNKVLAWSSTAVESAVHEASWCEEGTAPPLMPSSTL